MNDLNYPRHAAEDSELQNHSHPSAQDDAVPEFGLVDLVEAFTAMRHEWRGQTKESRAVAKSIDDAVASIQQLESKLLNHLDSSDVDTPKQFATRFAETDHQLTRAVTAVSQAETNRQQRMQADAEAIQRCFDDMNAVARWFARPLLTLVMERQETDARTTENPAIEGLRLVLARLRRTMQELQIERLESSGQVFDVNTMHAIGTVKSQDVPSGHVAEELSPAYRWRGQLLRFAEVRVAT